MFWRKQNPLIPIVFTVFLDLLGFGIVIPVLAPIFLDLEGGLFIPGTPLTNRTVLLGLLTASYSFAQFFGAPILGSLSDRIGRKKVLIVSLIGTFIGYILFAIGIMTKNLEILFLSRVLDGFTGGNISIAYSAIADISDKDTKTRNFGLVGMAFGLGFILGPFVGGKLADPTGIPWFSFTTPFFFAALLSLFNILLVIWKFPETLRTPLKSSISFISGFRNVMQAFTLVNLRILFLVIFLFTLGYNFLTQFFQVFLVQKFSFNPGQIGDIFAYTGLWVVISQGVLIQPLSKRYAPDLIVLASGFLSALVILALVFPHRSLYLWIILPLIAVLQGLLQPSITSILSNLTDEKYQGEALGINQSIQSIAQTIPPIIAGSVFALHLNLPTILSSIMTFIGWLVFVLFFIKPAKKNQYL